MGFKNRKRDDHGHVIGNDEVDGQKCQHVNGGSGSDNKQPKVKEFGSEKEAKEYFNKNADKLPDGTVMYGNKIYADNFDDDYDAEFTEADEKQYVDKVMDDISRANDKKAFEYVADNIDELTEAGLISEETSDRLYAELDSKIDESGENMPLFNTDLQRDREDIAKKEFDFQDAINIADDDVLDEYFGKDTPERKLVGASKKMSEADRDKKYEEAGKIISGAGMKDTNLTAAQRLKNDYVDGKITKDELINQYREHFKHSRDIVGNTKENWESIYEKLLDGGDASYKEHKGDADWDRAYYKYHHGRDAEMPENYNSQKDFSENDVVKLPNGEYGKISQIMPNGDIYVISRSGGKVYKSKEINKEGSHGDFLKSFHN